MKSGNRRPGFTLVELLFSILIIFLLMGILIAAVHHMVGGAKGTADRAMVTGLKDGVTHFKQQFNFVPPLVKDGYPPAIPAGPLVNIRGAGPAPAVYSFAVGSGTNPNPDLLVLQNTVPVLSSQTPGLDPRFSVYSLSYYLLGALDKGADGVDGPGFCAPKRDGSFERAGRKFAPFYDPRRGDAVYEQSPLGQGRIMLRDSRGVAFRYYRWATNMGTMLPNGTTTPPTMTDLNIPELVGKPQDNPELRSAEYAIVAAGPNGVFGDEDLLPINHPQRLKPEELEARVGLRGGQVTDPVYMQRVRQAAAADNIVEVGR